MDPAWPASGEQRNARSGAADLVAASAHGKEEGAENRQTRFNALRRAFRDAPKVATMDEMLTMRDSLRLEISNGKVEAKVELAGAVHRLSTQLAELRAWVESAKTAAMEERQRQGTEIMASTEGFHARLQEELRQTAAGLDGRLTQSVGAIEVALQASRLRELAREQLTERRLEELSAGVSSAMAVRWASMGALLTEQSRTLGSKLEALSSEVHRQCDATRSAAHQRAEECERRQQQWNDEHHHRTTASTEEFRGWCHNLDTRLQEHTGNFVERTMATVRTIEADIENIRQETQSRLAWLDEQGSNLRGLVAEVENIPTRRIEWVIQDAAVALQEGGLCSPVFAAAGSQGLRLELRLPEAASSEPGEDAGDCDLCLWANEGLFLVCRLYVGNASVQLQHTFDGQSPCIARRLCLLKEQVNAEDGSLHAGVEILEAVREVRRMGPSLTSAAAVKANLEASDAPQTSIVMHRYLNHRMLDLVQNQVELMRSRMVRKIEWRIEQGSALRRCFPEGECLCSTTFEAAGVEGLQLVFYPSGFTGAREGYCSYFLFCPAGSVLRCWLSIGKQRREGRLAFEQPGFYGRTNFCRYDSCVEASDDSLLLVLEIDEAQQNVTEALSHAVATPPEARSLASSFRLAASPDGGTPVPEKVDSSVKFLRAPGRTALEDVRQLPSIWTPRPRANVAEALEGFHMFSDLKSRKPAGGKRSGTSCRGDAPSPLGSAAASQPHPRYMMYAA